MTEPRHHRQPSPFRTRRRHSPCRRWIAACLLAWTFQWFAAPIASARETPIRFARIGVEEGLPDSHVHAIFQDRDDFIWFSTRDGLGRYDGYDMVVYRHDPFDPRTIHGNWVGTIHQDAAGDLWIPLGVGGIDVFRRADSTFVHLADRQQGPEGAGDVTAQSMQSRRGDVWFGTTSNGVYRWHAEQARLVPVASRDDATLDESRQLANSEIGDLIEDRYGRIWIGTCAGVDVFDPQRPDAPLWRLSTAQPGATQDASRLRRGAPTCVRALYEDVGGHLWLGTTGRGVVRLSPPDPAEGSASGAAPSLDDFGVTWLSSSWAEDPQPVGLRVRMIRGTDDGQVFFATPDLGLSRYDPDSGVYHNYSAAEDPAAGPASNNLSRLLVDRRGRLWIGTFDAGLSLLDAATDRFTHFRHDPLDPHSLSGDSIASLAEDDTGNLWVGTFGNGANVYSPYRWKFELYPPRRDGVEGPSGGVITSLVQRRDGHLWIGSLDGGLDRLDPQRDTFTQVPLTAARQLGVTSLLVDSQDQLWVGTLAGLVLRMAASEPARFSVLDALPKNMVPGQDLISALADDGSTLWIGTGSHGIIGYDRELGTSRQYMLDSGDLERIVSVWTLLVDHQGMLWIGTPSFGLHRFDPVQETFTVYSGTQRDVRDLANRSIKSLFEDRRGRLWIGTFSGGLSLFDRQRDAFIPWTVDQGLPSNKIEAILEAPDGRLWLSTNRGLASFLPGEATLRTYDRSDGLQHDEFQQGAALATPDGELYFGGRNGLNRFRPDRLQDNPHVPPVRLTSFRKFGRPVQLDRATEDVRRIVLAHHENVLSFHYAAIDFAHPKKHRYRYRLQGFDGQWVEAGERRSATYTNLDPGRYVFQVQGSNNDGIWNTDGVHVDLIIMPPFWQRWWFFALEGLLVLTGLILAFRYQRQRLERRQADLLRQQDHRRKTRELDSARRVQLAMLPSQDLQTERFTAVGRMVTASEVGGDYFDFFSIAPHRHAVTLGDAIGHGSAAGLVVGMVKSALHHALHAAPESRPADLLAALHRTLKESLADRRSGMGLTLLRLDAADRDNRTVSMHLASTAMPYPYLYRHLDGTLDSLELGGFPLGLGPSLKPRQLSFDLQPRDTLVLVSDGVVERSNGAGDVWGYDALQATLHRLCRGDSSAADLAAQILAASHAWANDHEPDDDLSCVVIRLHGAE